MTMAILQLAAAVAAVAIQPSDPVPGHPGVTYLDLIRQAVPGLALNRQDHQVEGPLRKPIRHIAGSEYEGDPPDPLVLDFIQDRRVTIGGKPRIAVLADLGADPDRAQDTALLLLFDDAPRPRLLDAADVSIDRDTEFAEDVGKVPLGPGDEAIVTYSEHLDADLSMGGYVLISPIGDRLAMVGLANVTSARLCGWSRIETAKVETAPDPGRPHPRIDLEVRVKDTRTQEDCGDTPRPKPSVRTFRASYRWSPKAGRYETEQSELKALDALNQAGF